MKSAGQGGGDSGFGGGRYTGYSQSGGRTAVTVLFLMGKPDDARRPAEPGRGRPCGSSRSDRAPCRVYMAAGSSFDHLFKILLIGDAGVGKSCILLRFTDDAFEEQMSSTIGVDFRVKTVTIGGVTSKLTIWDTAGQERFRTLTSSYYRGCHGIILVFDVNERETFLHLPQWLEELELYTTNQHAAKLLVGNKIDLKQREVSHEEATAFARKQAMMYIETSAKTREGIRITFEEVVQKILDTPALLSEGGAGSVKGLGVRVETDSSSSGGYLRGCC